MRRVHTVLVGVPEVRTMILKISEKWDCEMSK
jgi:hypothetical protein